MKTVLPGKSLMLALWLVAFSPLQFYSEGASAGPVMHRQTIKNDTNGDVNDLRLDFVPQTVKAKLWHTGSSVDTNNNDINEANERIESSDISLGNPSWAQNTFGTVSNGGFVDIDYETRSGRSGKLRPATSQWTLNGEDKGMVTVVGEPMRIALNSTSGEAFAVFINPEQFAITYSDIQLFANNDLANLTLDDFISPTGPLVTGLPSSIDLLPGESAALSFGIVDPISYQLARAFASETGTTEFFSVASAAIAVPEPSTMALLGFGLAAFFCVRKAREPAAKTA